LLVAAVVPFLVAACSQAGRPTATPTRSPDPTASPATVSGSPSPSRSTSAGPTTSNRVGQPDPRWRFFTDDRRPRTSPWFAGAHPVMIGYGCTVAPYYSHDPRCPGRQGFHHGVDVAMPCGTALFSAVRGTVLDPASAGAPGAAYGPYAFRIRTGGPDGRDVLVGHVRKVYVDPGEAVRPGQLVARASDQGAPDGCHLHFEVRRVGTGLSGAVDPEPYLRLRPRG
jgi:murein DD-endopeptidase MepM/ murein hydrolase activator NlpD